MYLSVLCSFTSCKSLVYHISHRPQRNSFYHNILTASFRKLARSALIVEEILIFSQESFPHYFSYLCYWLAYFSDMNPSNKDGKNKDTPSRDERRDGTEICIENSYFCGDLNGNL